MGRTSKFTPEEQAKRVREKEARKAQKLRADVKEIGPLPKRKRPALYALCEFDLKLFALSYFKKRLFWPFSDSHLEDIATLQRCVLHGGLFAYARPRGEGKTVLAEIASIWATAYGHRRYVLIVAANDKPLAQAILESIQRTLEENDELYDEFPEICHPIRMLQGVRQRAGGQTLNPILSKKHPDPGPRTAQEFTGDGIRLATVHLPSGELAKSSGAIIETVGITGAIRGRKSLSPSGESLRPDFIICDDPQTRESAKSPSQTRERVSIIRGDILGLAGPDKNIACVMPCTVIYPRDLADQFLDRQVNPQWQGRRTKRLLAWPVNMDLWDQYREVRAEGLRLGDDGRGGNEFYKKHRLLMDEGARVSWVNRVKAGEVSAIQGAMNRWIDDPEEFYAEDQNEPRDRNAAQGDKEFDIDQVQSAYSGVPRLIVPEECTRLTGGIDIQKEIIYYVLTAWNESFGGFIVDYGTFPKQLSRNYTAKDPRPSLAEEFPDHTDPQKVFAGLQALTQLLMDREYERRGGGNLRLNMTLIDSGYLTPTIYQFVRQSSFAATIHPSKGFGRTRTTRSVGEWKKKPGERAGYGWKLTAGEFGRTRAVQFDPDPWKTFIHTAILTPRGDPSGLTLFGDEEYRRRGGHELFASHLWAEKAKSDTVRGTRFDAWEHRPGNPDNHYFDALILSAVAASVNGLVFTARPKGQAEAAKPKRKKVSFAERQKEQNAKNGADPLGRF